MKEKFDRNKKVDISTIKHVDHGTTTSKAALEFLKRNRELYIEMKKQQGEEIGYADFSKYQNLDILDDNKKSL